MSEFALKSIFEEGKIKDTFNHYGIDLLVEDKKGVPDKDKQPLSSFKFSKYNVVIGANGSGKSRFLRAIRDLYKTDTTTRVVYGYFPEISVSTPKKRESKTDLPQYSLYSSLTEPDASFEDFLHEIELRGISYLVNLFNWSYRVERDRNISIITKVQDTFKELTGYTLIHKPDNRGSDDHESDQFMIADSDSKNPCDLYKKLKEFSPGELMLFYMSIFLSFPSTKGFERVIILDEPECHLHPEALLTFISKLKQLDGVSSVWIATHSLFLVPEFEFEDLVYIKDSKVIKRNSKLYTSINESLLGKHGKNIAEYFRSVDQWQIGGFLAECFLGPEVKDFVDSNDRQAQAFLNELREHDACAPRILDYGGGAGRLGKTLAEVCKGEKTYFYSIYDPMYAKEKNKEQKANLEKLSFPVYDDPAKIKGEYDFVVLMNALHEIKPSDWISTFSKISKLLKSGGYLIFVEERALHKGEWIDGYGYMVLSESELNILFGKDADEPKPIKTDERMICVSIPKENIENVNDEKISAALLQLEQNALQEIKNLRISQNTDRPRTYAFWVQQYINAKLYNEGIKEKITINLLEKLKPEFITIDTKLYGDVAHSIYKAVCSKCDGKSDGAEAHDWFEELLKLDKAYKNNTSMAVLWIAAALLGDPICREIVKHNSNYLETLNNLMGDEVSFEKSMKILKWQDGKKIAV